MLAILFGDYGTMNFSHSQVCSIDSQTAEPSNAQTPISPNLANALYKNGEMSKSIQHYTAVLKINPDFVEAHNNLAAIYYSQSQFGRAIHHYSEALRVNPDSEAAKKNLEQALRKQRKMPK
jgi:tetratricopeptide (TPR) repeat protein